ncbi:PepSY domain-containing protein [Qipengyuania gaetbuli]|uniref:PepSY domain-containing protein n=1 Tax=Qipengyuania gaetbuli TaxID=266952 RepID=UPI001CD463B5|nr:PepSY domain-containing protein [Qipengyuania gaetbuli]MCA0909191.1 PepSY domain-containing protein [Qipengyuania gaetbuli]
MKRLLSSFLAVGLVAGPIVAAPLAAQSRSDQGEARKEMSAGRTLSLRQIEARILPTMGDAEYLGPAYDSVAVAYRLKFIRNGRVLFVDVDARTGRVIRRSN